MGKKKKSVSLAEFQQMATAQLQNKGGSNTNANKKKNKKKNNKNKNTKNNTNNKNKQQKKDGEDNKKRSYEVSHPYQIKFKPSDTVEEIATLVKNNLVSVEEFDPSMIYFMSNMIFAQRNPSTAMKQQDLIQNLLRVFKSFNEFEMGLRGKEKPTYNTNEDDEQNIAQELIKKCIEKNYIDEEVEVKSSTDISTLKTIINMGKEYEESQEKKKKNSYALPNANYQEMEDARLSRSLRKKAARERQLQEREYEDFLKARGLSRQKALMVRLHNVDQHVKGTRNIKIHDIDISIGNTTLLSSATLNLNYGHRYGMIGRNGVGKTTLLRNIFERELPGVPPYLQILHVEQEVQVSEKTCLEVVLESDVERTHLLKEEQRLLAGGSDNVDQLQELYDRMEMIDAHSAESRAAHILSGLSFTHEMMHQATNSLSGGWRMKLALAQALFIEPDVLFLDEPTNHIDLHAVLWLEDFLRKWKKTLVIVSHARTFLNEIATDIIHFSNADLTYYKGNYSVFEQTLEQRLLEEERVIEAQQKKRKHLQSFVDRFRYKAATAKMAQSRLKMLEKMNVVSKTNMDSGPALRFEFPYVDKETAPYLQSHGLTFGYSKDKILFREMNFSLDSDSRIGLVGPNGAGKSTFLKLLIEDLAPLEGSITKNRKVRIAIFDQHHEKRLNMSQTPVEYLKSCYPHLTEPTIREQLGRVGLTKHQQPIYTLSGGQKSRVSFAYIFLQSPHLILMDEPTNHLDMETIDALIAAVNDYEGGVMVISHDEYFINLTCNELWVIKEGNMSQFNGDFTDYKRSLGAH